ncbi:myeloid leukemia factor 2-like isoform X2 [Littorina saxatilis]
MRQMNQMFATPFGFGTGAGAGGMMGIQGGQQQQQLMQQQQHRQQQQQLQQQQQMQQQQQLQQRGHSTQLVQRQTQPVMPTDLFGFGAFGGMFQNMRRMMDDMNNTFENGATNPNGQVFTQSSFMSYSNLGDQPKVYQASSSTTQLPGGVRETRKTVRDSESGVEKIAVGHHIRERGHVVQRQRNRHTGSQEENREYINLDEEEAPEFDKEWLEQSRQMYGPNHNPARLQQHLRRHHPHHHPERSNRRALTAPSHRHSQSHPRSPSYRDRE